MASYALCSREAAQKPINITTDAPAVQRDAPTWQQQKAFGTRSINRRSRKGNWQHFDLNAEPPVDNNWWSLQQAEIPAQALSHKPHGKASTSNSPQFASPPTSPHPSQDKDTQSQKDRQRRPRFKDKNDSKAHNNPNSLRDDKSKMIQVSQRAYVPPHMRKHAAAAKTSAKPEVPIADESITIPVAVNQSITVSDVSKPEHCVESSSSPHGIALVVEGIPSPPTTAPEETKAVEANTWTGWKNPKPDPPSAAARPKNPNWPRGPKPAPKKTVWPKQRDMKPLPSESDRDGGGVEFRSNSNGDPDYDVKKLQDWNGDWLPPPEEWSARRGYTNRHFGQDMEDWMNTHSKDCTRTMNIESASFSGKGIGDEEVVLKDLVPRYWVLSAIDSDPLRRFWEKLQLCAPAPLSDDGTTANPPFWDMYESEGSCYLSGLVVPDARVDPEDPDNYKRGEFTGQSIASYLDMLAKKNHARHLSMLKRRNRPIPEPKASMPQQEDRRLKPSGNIYLRPVHPTDVRGITEIYNYYIQESIHAVEFDARTEQQMANRINNITREGLPYLVAIARGNRPRGPKGFVSEKIIGYINLDDYCGQSTLHRFTFEMELYVHPGFTCQNVAKCLLDRLLEMVNTGYNALGGYEYVNEYDYLKTGPCRVVKTILLNVFHEHKAEKELPPWTKILGKFKFVRCGHVSQIGYKKGQVVDMSMFQHRTTETIDPKSIPTV